MTVLAGGPLEGLVCPPAWHHVPTHALTYGDEAADLGAATGLPLDPEQRLVVDACFAVDETDRLVATEVGACAPRQNVKSHSGKVAALADLVLFAQPECVWSAHLRETAYEMFRNKYGTGLADIFESYDWLRRLVLDVKDSDGERSITLRAKAAGEPKPSISFVTRSERGGRGKTGRRVTYDEALFLKPSMVAAMVPILSAQSMSGQVQVRYLGSPGLLHSAVWREVRDRGRDGTAAALAWIEWAARRMLCEQENCSHRFGHVQGCALDREDLVREANLAVDRRIHIKFVMQTERGRLTPVDFMRERLGWWEDPPEGAGVLDMTTWAARNVGDQPIGRAVLAVEVSPGNVRTTIGAAWKVDGVAHVEIVDERPGVGWVGARVAELRSTYRIRTVVIDPATEAGRLESELSEAKLQVLTLKAAERPTACGLFRDAVADATLTHNGDPALDAALVAARTKDVGDGAQVFTRRKSVGDISALYAVVLAHWGLSRAIDMSSQVW